MVHFIKHFNTVIAQKSVSSTKLNKDIRVIL